MYKLNELLLHSQTIECCVKQC